MRSSVIRKLASVFLFLLISGCAAAAEPTRLLVLLSDFGDTERFVASMKGVAMGVDPALPVHDLSHKVEPFNIWQASYLLAGTLDFWPRGTVFVSVVDPGVGTPRKSVVAQTASGHFIVTPDNGSLTLVDDAQGIVALREIDESVNRRPGSGDSHTFHGRDVYAYTGAKLAAGKISFEQVGPPLSPEVVRLDYQSAGTVDGSTIVGNITHIELPFGNVVTNIPQSMLDGLSLSVADQRPVRVEISHAGKPVLQQTIPYVPAFGYVDTGQPLLYSDSLQMIGLAVNSGNYSRQFKVRAGADWRIRIVINPSDSDMPADR